MKTIMNAVLCLLLGMFCTASFSAKTIQNLSSAVAFEAELIPNEPQLFYNFLMWKVTGKCLVESESIVNPVSFQMITNKGTLNGIEFSPGESLSLIVTPGEEIQLGAEPRAKVEVMNQGTQPIKLKCSPQS